MLSNVHTIIMMIEQCDHDYGDGQVKRKQTKWEQIIDTVKKTAEKLPGAKKEFDDHEHYLC